MTHLLPLYKEEIMALVAKRNEAGLHNLWYKSNDSDRQLPQSTFTPEYTEVINTHSGLEWLRRECRDILCPPPSIHCGNMRAIAYASIPHFSGKGWLYQNIPSDYKTASELTGKQTNLNK